MLSFSICGRKEPRSEWHKEVALMLHSSRPLQLQHGAAVGPPTTATHTPVPCACLFSMHRKWQQAYGLVLANH